MQEEMLEGIYNDRIHTEVYRQPSIQNVIADVCNYVIIFQEKSDHLYP